jgi:flagellar biosynthesis protein FliQ
MNAGTALATLESLSQPIVASWPVFASGLACGLLLGVLLAALAFRGRNKARRKQSFFHALLSLAPAVVACLLWGLWLGILAAKSLAR